MWRSSRFAISVAAAAAVLLASPRVAHADGTVFAGAFLTPARETLRGFSVGMTVILAGVEFEYARVAEDEEARTPSHQAGSLSVLVQTPTGRVKLYGLLGAGLFRDQIGGATIESGATLHAGGGLKIGLAGPVGLRLDYRVISFSREGEDRHRQRVYAGLRVEF